MVRFLCLFDHGQGAVAVNVTAGRRLMYRTPRGVRADGMAGIVIDVFRHYGVAGDFRG